MPSLFEHQEICIADTSTRFLKHKRVMLCAATGIGKTFIASEIAKRALLKGKRVLILVHRIEIFDQFLKTLALFGLHPGVIAPGYKMPMPGNQLFLGMVETYHRRAAIAKQYNIDFMICDEGHWGSYEKVVEGLNIPVLLLSATPVAAAGNALHTYIDGFVMPIKVSELIHTNFLCRGRTYSIEHNFDHIKKSGKDYDALSLAAEFSKPVLRDGLLENYEKYARGLKSILYSVNVEKSLEQCRIFNEAGYRACHIDGDTPKEQRKAYLKSFAEGIIDILCNVAIATTGYDEPTIRCVMQNFATMQIAKQHQTGGRGGRPDPNDPSKIDDGFVILDQGNNYLRHKCYGADVEWEAIFNNPILATNRKAERSKFRECVECGAVIEMMLHECPYCDHSYTPKEIERAFLERATLQEIKDYKIEKLPVTLRTKKITQMTYQELQMYAEAMGKSKQWVGAMYKKPWNRKGS